MNEQINIMTFMFFSAIDHLVRLRLLYSCLLIVSFAEAH